jgi:hypothetical protein
MERTSYIIDAEIESEKTAKAVLLQFVIIKKLDPVPFPDLTGHKKLRIRSQDPEPQHRQLWLPQRYALSFYSGNQT